MGTQPPLVVIVMGSRSDAAHCEEIAAEARSYGMQVVTRIASAHKTAAHALSVLQEYEQEARPRVYITVAGRSNALSGFVDGAVKAPVIACPPASQSYGGADVFSSLRMPSGIAPGVVLEPRNAALLAAKILGLVDKKVRAAVIAAQSQRRERIISDDDEIQ
ncbi:MAG: 5-(carboxyamino)imidazole ribonucleotide mutase [Anaerolineales bacterium]|jgi:5-(carboxyamino)imidazole ribonucleotide mutase/phosphoribosylaminoimidazole-succinocarboxamide synthase|nr:5-(carboxyamino)imidazole ribonucleotide mutase [Anaerolineales bacterium]MDP7345832.1 5-(carboxyamino)imidazole ribonucleotide mutase [Anaerolineales bacterium]MDP7643947.1 5-(carboxyamino)imidazole ribonucleotide mutase [Anaerolineales bacterium]HJL70186.1 AIR carboxylase family protein [Anaerolineales bacterium]|tara:strand:- start:815 stop:1300 length:486 start_codon:yes stop_codon:yes gene_type:complete